MSTLPFPPADANARAELIEWIRETPLVYGPWQHFKCLYKEAETAWNSGTREPEVLAALLARFDAQALDEKGGDAAVAGNFGLMHFREDYAYILADNNALQTFDMSAPMQPKLTATLPLEGSLSPYYAKFEFAAGYLWLHSGAEFWAFDVSTAAQPVLVGNFDTRSHLTAFVGGNIVTFADQTDMRVSQLQNGELVEVGSCALDLEGGYATQIAVNQSIVSLWHYNYSGRSYQYYVQTVDVSDPANPRVTGQSQNRGRGNNTTYVEAGEYNVSVDGSKLYLYDVSDPAKPRELSKINVAGARSVVSDGAIAVVNCYEWNQNGQQRTLRFVDLSRPKSLSLLGELDVGELENLALSNGLLYASARDGLHIYDISNPARAQEIGKSPDPKTFAYLKRRGRRFLRLLSQTDEAAFCRLAAAFFAEIGERPNLNWDIHWIAADLVAAHHPNWYQASHGRGAYLYQAESFVLSRRVERAPAAWDAHPESLRELAQSSVTAPVVHLARQVCQVQTPLTPAQIESYVSSRWPNLRALGARGARDLVEANAQNPAPDSDNVQPFGVLSPRALAGALFASNARQRRELLDIVGAPAALGSELASFLGESAPLERDRFGRRQRVSALTRRGREVALLLAARFDLSDPAFQADGALPILRALLSAGEAPLRALGAQFCRRLSAEQVLPLIPFALENAAVAEALLESASRADFDKAQIDKVVRAAAPAARALAWQLVEASQTGAETLNAVWMSLLRGLSNNYNWQARTRSWQISGALLGAASDANARACLVRGALDPREVRPRWSAEFAETGSGYYASSPVPAEIFAVYALFLPAPTVVAVVATLPDALWDQWKAAFATAIAPHASVTAEFWRATQEYLDAKKPNYEELRARTFNDPALAATFAGAAGQLPPALLLTLIATVPDEVWQGWRGRLLEVLQTDSARREAFWEAARLQGFESQLLKTRLIEDAEFAATFGRLDEVLAFDDPALEALLLVWLGARALDGETLIEAAIHPLPAVRAIGLSGLSERGLSVPVALRLLESDLRDAMDAARSWFESRQENIANLALALCDSPRLRVREYGREFVVARLDALLSDGLLERLEENPNAEMQAFVAELLLKNAAPAVEFDRAVLRGRNRARHAKNLVQERRAHGEPLPDDATLLELARGKTPRDAEWALMQLARRALAGEVEGVEVSGVGAI